MSLSVWAFTAHAAFVVEFYDASSGRYFLSSDPGETTFVDGGGAGRTWVETGYTFETVCPDLYPSTACGFPTVPVCRFYGAPPLGSGSHFFTADAGECAAVRQNPAWQFEGTPFKATVPDPSTGTCHDGYIPVYRAYNNAAQSTQVRHRWTTSRAVQDRMIAKGWKDEGIAFCALYANQLALRSFKIQVDSDHVLTSAECAANLNASRSCVGFNNLPDPRTRIFFSSPLPDPRGGWFFDVTGLGDGGDVFSVITVNPVVPTASLREEATHAFVQLFEGDTFGIHVDTNMRGSGNLTSVNPLYQFDLFGPADGVPDERFTPFAGQYDTDVDVVLSFNLHLKELRTTPGSSAYGHTTLDILDRSSNLHFYFIVLGYGTVPTVDNVIRDGPAGNPIVVTAFRESPYGRNYAAQVMATPAPFAWPGAGAGGYYEFHINTAEFQRIVTAARTVEPRLSANLADYAFDDFHFNSEVAGDGEIGENFSDLRVDLVPAGDRPASLAR